MEREAGEAKECQALQEEQEPQPRQEKQNHTYPQPFLFGGHALGTRTRAARARSAVLSWGRLVLEILLDFPEDSYRFPRGIS